MGLQLENLILGNLATIFDKIGLANVPVLNAAPYCRRSTHTQKGCQVDLLIRTRQFLYVLEVKFRRQIDKGILSEVREKVERLKVPRSLSVRTGLVFQGELHSEIQPSDYFDFLLLWVAEIPSSLEMIAWRGFATKLCWSCLKFSGPF